MPPLFFYSWSAGLYLFALVYPFLAVCCGKGFVRTFLAAWGGLLLFVILVCVVLPSILFRCDKELAYEMGDLHLEPPFVFAVLVAGWIFPLFASAVGFGCRQAGMVFLKSRAAKS